MFDAPPEPLVVLLVLLVVLAPVVLVVLAPPAADVALVGPPLEASSEPHARARAVNPMTTLASAAIACCPLIPLIDDTTDVRMQIGGSEKG
jgi:hypothetical protein